MDAAVLADPAQPGHSVLEEGPHVSAETSRRLACDASRVVMRHDADGRVIEVGARTRTIPPALRRALQHRDKTCRFPGCNVRIAEGHHVRHWAHGGPTKLSNLALLCRRHHRAVHEEGYQVERRPDGALQFRRPDGQPLPAVPPPVAVPADPAGAIRAQNAAQGLKLHPRTGLAQWFGERLDVQLGDRRAASAGRASRPTRVATAAGLGWPQTTISIHARRRIRPVSRENRSPSRICQPYLARNAACARSIRRVGHDARRHVRTIRRDRSRACRRGRPARATNGGGA